MNDALTVAQLDADAAWEAHRQVSIELEKAQVELAGLKRLRFHERPVREAFEKIATRVFEWKREGVGAVPSSDCMERIEEHVKEARAQTQRIAALQRRSREAA
jgi:hypothetical protein